MSSPRFTPLKEPTSPSPQELYVAIVELQRQVAHLVRKTQELDESFFSVSHVEPVRPRETMIRFADGTDWNPGAGRGLYQYVSGAWVKL